MTSDPTLPQRVARLENDTESIYELLVEHTARFDNVDARLDSIAARLAGHDARFDGLDERLDGIASTLAEVVRRLPEPRLVEGWR